MYSDFIVLQRNLFETPKRKKKKSKSSHDF